MPPPVPGTAIHLGDFLITGAAPLDDFIKASSRTRQPIFATLALRGMSGTPQNYRAEAVVYQPGDQPEPATVFIRLTPFAGGTAAPPAIDPRLQSMVQPHGGTARVVNLNDLVATGAALLRPLLGDRIELVTRLATTAPLVHADPMQVERVLVNVGVHARDQMTAGGQIRIEAGAADSAATVTVSDTGPLPSAAALEAMFEPWSSDQSDPARSGISLASSRAAISEIGGTIEVRRGETAGTVFTLRIPLARTAGLTPAAQRAAATTVLVVDDDDVARDLIVGALSSAHYTVLSAADGAGAVDLVRDHDGAINLLVTDVVMPRLNGPRVAEMLRAGHPKMRVLYLSGYTDGVDLPINTPGAPSAFLAKPFTRGTLLARVQALLDK